MRVTLVALVCLLMADSLAPLVGYETQAAPIFAAPSGLELVITLNASVRASNGEAARF